MHADRNLMSWQSVTQLKIRLDRTFETVELRNFNTVPKRQCRSQMCVEWRDCGPPFCRLRDSFCLVTRVKKRNAQPRH